MYREFPTQYQENARTFTQLVGQETLRQIGISDETTETIALAKLGELTIAQRPGASIMRLPDGRYVIYSGNYTKDLSADGSRLEC